MHCVLPKIQHHIAVQLPDRNAVIRIQHLEQRLVIGHIFRIRFELAERRRVLLCDPLEGSFAVNIFQPNKWIVSLHRMPARVQCRAGDHRRRTSQNCSLHRLLRPLNAIGGSRAGNPLLAEL